MLPNLSVPWYTSIESKSVTVPTSRSRAVVDDITALKYCLPRCRVAADRSGPSQYRDKLKYRFSAAAATHFLKDTSEIVRTRIRKIILYEDRIAVAWPECHAQGLIPFCQENTMLKIERNVDLWRNALHGGADALWRLRELSPQTLQNVRADCLRAGDATGSIAPWVMEALALPSLGMPADAFTLTFDGEPLPEKIKQVFEVMQRDTAWQDAFEADCLEKQISWFDTRTNWNYIMSGFPQAVQEITSGNSIMKCNFELPQSWGVNGIKEQGRDWSLEEWTTHWPRRPHYQFDTDPPLPSWLGLRREDIITD